MLSVLLYDGLVKNVLKGEVSLLYLIVVFASDVYNVNLSVNFNLFLIGVVFFKMGVLLLVLFFLFVVIVYVVIVYFVLFINVNSVCKGTSALMDAGL